MDPNQVRKVGGRKDAALLAVAVILIIAAIAAVIYIFVANPSFVESLVNAAITVIVALAVIQVALWIITMVIGIGYYAKGTTVQTEKSYDLDDVKPVEGSMLDKDKEK